MSVPDSAEGASPRRTSPAPAPAADPRGGSGKRYLALTAMLCAVSMTFIDQTIVSIASPEVARELDLGRGSIQWVINGYILALAASFALGGRWADVFGSKRMVLIGILGFAGSSALCGLTPTGSLAGTWIVGFRVLQGVSAAIMIPAALAVVVASFPIRERGRALAIFFGVSGGLTAVGPIAGGYLTQWTWRAIFWVNIPIAVLAIVLTLLAHIDLRGRRARIDVRGALLVAVGMALSVLGLEQANSWGWDDLRTWACIIGGLVVLAVFVLVELRTRVPLIKVRIFRDRAFSIDNGVLFFSMMAFVPVFFFASVYSQVSLGFGASSAGLYLLVFFGGFAPAAQIGGRILDSRGARPAMIAGGALGTLGFALWATRVTELDLGAQWWAIVLAGAGIGLLLGPASTDAVNRSIDASYGEVTGISQTLRNYGSSLGLAVLGSVLGNVFADRLTISFEALGIPADEAARLASAAATQAGGGTGAGGASAAPAALQTGIEAAVATDFALATQAVLWGMAIALAVSCILALFHPGGRVTEERTAEAAAPATG
ncbi:MFS transporter [Nakamurella flavida]|uniref:MFS transporter n=1 Tax=Nakamurella flavida TaxID=363630 RepID=A0A938YHU8_9ACTN|nr:MFS transporter [Nakamurella flavida]MBM9475023.1 MFS transporter [Nakamurella flavida]MDP9776592.1 EmrB/QacA subfamily drug resistance transporter [Nakamurella flavida]